MEEPHVKGFSDVGCSFRELKAFKQVEHAIVAQGEEAFLAARQSTARKEQAVGTLRHQLSAVFTWQVRASEDKVP